ncbi:MAG: lipid-A-disaccharide synthase [Rikenellaceae bacterium]
MKYYFIVGEPSGDLHASKVMNKIKKRDSRARFRFWGGDKMCEVAGRESMVEHISQTSFMGFIDVAKNVSKIGKQLKQCKEDLAKFKPDVVVLVDYAGFNIKIAKFAKQKGIKVFYYIAPKVWAWKEHRVKSLKKYVDELFVIFPFEVDYFHSKSMEVHYFGNPLMDAIDKTRASQSDKEAFFKEIGVDQTKKCVALVAGSRKGEIRDNLPFMVKVANRFEQFQFIVTAVPWIDNQVYEKYLAGSIGNIKIVTDKTYQILGCSDAAIVTSGTATLETALLKTPEFVCYYTPPLTTFIAKRLIKIKYASLVNIILGREAVKELLHKNMTVENASAELVAIMEGGDRHDKIMSDYDILEKMMGEGEVSGKVAEKMIELASK